MNPEDIQTMMTGLQGLMQTMMQGQQNSVVNARIPKSKLRSTQPQAPRGLALWHANNPGYDRPGEMFSEAEARMGQDQRISDAIRNQKFQQEWYANAMGARDLAQTYQDFINQRQQGNQTSPQNQPQVTGGQVMPQAYRDGQRQNDRVDLSAGVGAGVNGYQVPYMLQAPTGLDALNLQQTVPPNYPDGVPAETPSPRSPKKARSAKMLPQGTQLQGAQGLPGRIMNNFMTLGQNSPQSWLKSQAEFVSPPLQAAKLGQDAAQIVNDPMQGFASLFRHLLSKGNIPARLFDSFLP